MARKAFDQELRNLQSRIGSMGVQVDEVIGDTIKALKNHDLELARYVFQHDNAINASQNNIEQMCFNLIALQQPIAADLRLITSILKMVTDVERIGDQCADICEIMATYPDFTNMKTPPDIINMFMIAREMFNGAIDSFMRRDLEEAERVIKRDDEVDNYFSRVVLDMSRVLSNDHTLVSQATDYMFIAKYIERIADHAVNIAEWTIYAATGEQGKPFAQHPDEAERER